MNISFEGALCFLHPFLLHSFYQNTLANGTQETELMEEKKYGISKWTI